MCTFGRICGRTSLKSYCNHWWLLDSFQTILQGKSALYSGRNTFRFPYLTGDHTKCRTVPCLICTFGRIFNSDSSRCALLDAVGLFVSKDGHLWKINVIAGDYLINSAGKGALYSGRNTFRVPYLTGDYTKWRSMWFFWNFPNVRAPRIQYKNKENRFSWSDSSRKSKSNQDTSYGDTQPATHVQKSSKCRSSL